MDRSTQGRVVMAAFCGAMLMAVESAAAALPVAGARFAVHDHATKGAAWHVELEVSRRDPAVLRTIVAFDERCDETVAAERARLTPEGVLDAGGAFTAFDADGREQAGTWEIDARFVTPQRVEGSYRIAEPGCEASRAFTAFDRRRHVHPTTLGYPDVSAATPAARRQARRKLRRVRAVARRRFPTIERARAQGFTRYMAPGAPAPGVFHLWSRANHRDDRILVPRRVESLVYWKPTTPRAAPILLAFMFRVRPGPRPRFAGGIPVWHQHKKGGDSMIHVWRTRGLRAAYANCLPVPELERSLRRFDHEDVPNQLHESQPCPQ